MKRRIVSLCTALIFLISLFGAAPQAAGAETHMHKICTDEGCTDAEHDDITWTAWESDDSLPGEAGNYYLTKDVNIERAWEPANGTNLCLNGKTITVTGTTEVIYIRNGRTFSLCDCAEVSGSITGGKNGGVVNSLGTFYLYGGEISGNSREQPGGGVYSSGAFYMYGGEISDNRSERYGGGVNSSGTFHLYGGKISGNSSEDTTTNGGGGVCSSAMFYMHGGEISGNISKTSGGGVMSTGYATFYLYGGKITNNSAESFGGGVDSSGEFYMRGGEISGNSSKSNGGGGGGVSCSGTFYLFDGKITGNRSEHPSGGNGGGVLNHGMFYMHGGEISGNVAGGSGGGVSSFGTFYLYDGEISGNTTDFGAGLSNNGTFYMYGGKVTGNECPNGKNSQGGGIETSGSLYLYGGEISGNIAETGAGIQYRLIYGSGVPEITLGGTIVIKDNVSKGGELRNVRSLSPRGVLYLDAERPLTDGAYIGVYTSTTEMPTEGNPVNITAANDKDYSKYFHSDNIKYEIMNGTDNVVQLVAHANHKICTDESCTDAEHSDIIWTAWESGDSLPSGTGNYYLTKDVAINTRWEPAKGTKLCLNGKTITQTANESLVIYIPNGHVFSLCDCIGGGKITGGTQGGVMNTCDFYLYGGKISGNHGAASAPGGGVRNHGNFYMYGGEISDNVSVKGGGGIYNGVTFYMYNGKIMGNDAADEGGALLNYKEAYLYGGEISGNTAQNGAGIYGVGLQITAGGSNTFQATVAVGGTTVIKDNQDKDGNANNVVLAAQEAIRVDADKPLAGAYIGIRPSSTVVPTEGNPVSVTGANAADVSGYFHSDKAEYEIVNGVGNAVQLAVKETVTPSPEPSASPSASPSVSPSPDPGTSPSPDPSVSPSPSPTSKPSYGGSGGGSSKRGTSVSVTAPETAAPNGEQNNSSGTKRHRAYMVGRGDVFCPDEKITRAEAAAIFARLTDGFDENGGYASSFPDVAEGAWYCGYIGFAESKNVMQGYPDKTFQPDKPVSRAEFVTTCMRFSGLGDGTTAESLFADVSELHWASGSIAHAYSKGWISGYPDNTFRPDAEITRAEAVTMINRMMGRKADAEYIDNHISAVNMFADVEKDSHWAFYDIMEASFAHSIAGDTSDEVWTE